MQRWPPNFELPQSQRNLLFVQSSTILEKRKEKRDEALAEFKYKKKDMSTDDNALNSSDASEAANLTTSKREY